MDEKLTEMVTVRMSQALRARLEQKAKADHRKVSDVVRLVLEQALSPLSETSTTRHKRIAT